MESYTFAELLRSFMSREGITQAELARMIGKQRSTIGNWYSGETKPRQREEVLKVTNALYLSEEDTDRLLVAAGYAAEYSHPTPERYEPNPALPGPIPTELPEPRTRFFMGR